MTMPRVPPFQRDASFDAVKGALVMLMVVYHVLSISTTAGAEAFRYMRFLSGSFVLISGFVVTRFMGDRFAQAPGDTSRHLLERGLKVLAIFAVLNLAIHASGFGHADKPRLGVQGFAENAATIFLRGDGVLSSFLILLPIAYLLMLAPLFLWAARRSTVVFPCVALVAVLARAAIAPEPAPVAGFVLLGLVGLCLGTPALSRRLVGTGRPAPLATTAGLLVSLWFAGRHANSLAAYGVGVALVLRFGHDAVRALPRRWLEAAALAGRYSLPAYIVQIVLIQTVFRALGGQRVAPDAATVALIAGVAATTVALCVLIERLRTQSAVVDKTYRWVFA